VTSEAPGDLELVRRFVNTWDVEQGTDSLDGPDGLAAALAGLLEPGTTVRARDVHEAVKLREALREALLANHDGSDVPPDALAVLNETAARAGLNIGFAGTGWHPATVRKGVDGALGRLLAIVVRAMADGSWRRLKACQNDACRWAFYDQSNARASKWCDMRICGNRAKQKAFRARTVIG
jgi:predicted RNA-binding Zn ribbon-like protein